MGVNLRDLVPKTTVNLTDLNGKSIAIDAYNALYQFLAIIRQPAGTPPKDHTGRVTSHLSGLLYRTSNLVEMGIKAAYVFDGVPPTLKEVEIKRRAHVKEEALVKYEKALQEGKMEEARTYAQITGHTVGAGAKRRRSPSCPHDHEGRHRLLCQPRLRQPIIRRTKTLTQRNHQRKKKAAQKKRVRRSC